MRIFVINLERSVARRASIQQQLNKLGMTFEFIKAVDGALLTDDYLARVCDFEQLATRPHLLHKGVFGCALSHYSVYQKIVDENISHALILEDDIIVNEELKKILLEIVPKIEPAEVILLFSQNTYMATVLSKQHTQTVHADYQLSYPINPWALSSAAGYIITKDAAQGMLDFLLPIKYGADEWGAFYDNKAIKSLRCLTPFVVQPAGFKSDIDYVSNSSILGKTLALINKYHIFPFKQLLNHRRRQALRKSSQYSFSTEFSPVMMAKQYPL